MAVGREEIEHRFGRHKAALEAPDSVERHGELRELWTEFAAKLDDLLDDSRAKSVAFTELESASMWSHKALAYSLFEDSKYHEVTHKASKNQTYDDNESKEQ